MDRIIIQQLHLGREIPILDRLLLHEVRAQVFLVGVTEDGHDIIALSGMPVLQPDLAPRRVLVRPQRMDVLQIQIGPGQNLR